MGRKHNIITDELGNRTIKNIIEAAFKRVFFLVVACAIAFNSYGFGRQQHTGDMQRVFPFEWDNDKIIELYYLVNDYLDKPNDTNTGKPTLIAEHPKFGKMTFGNHRIWYHWGFNVNPRNFTPLKEAVERNIKKGVITETDAKEFWDILLKEVGRRNRYLMNKATEILGYGKLGSISAIQRAQANAFVTILYSIHLLGDHQGKILNVMSDRNAVYADIYNAIDNLAGREAYNVERAKSIKKELRKHQDSPADFINAMERRFTPFILSLKGPMYNYKQKFEKMGYKLKSCRCSL